MRKGAGRALLRAVAPDPTPRPDAPTRSPDPTPRDEEPTVRPWRDHLEPDDPLAADSRPGAPGLTGAGTLLHLWAERWAADPSAPLWHGADRWWAAGEFDEATRRAAGRLRGAGLEPGQRIVWSTDSSVDALVAHVGALRAGLVVVPANTAYSERELAHIVADVRASAAVVGRPEQADWVRAAASGPIVVADPGLDLPDAD